jgi:WD40 repeat protein
MVMAVKLLHHTPSNNTLVLAGYEGGFTAVHLLPRNPSAHLEATRKPILTVAQTVYLSQPHSQPILSLDALPDGTAYFTSSADAIIAAHRIPDLLPLQEAEQSSLATADKIIDHTCNAESSSPILLSSASLKPTDEPSAPSVPPVTTAQPPFKSVSTKHAGQQSLCVRSDGRLLATGGWDSRVRIYSTKTLKEMAVLKWHKEGVYAVHFGHILDPEEVNGKSSGAPNAESVEDAGIVKKETGLSRLQRQREESMQFKHWVVAGAKDGKVSLWEVF